MKHSKLLKINALMFGTVLFVGLLVLVGGMLRMSYRIAHPNCGSGDFNFASSSSHIVSAIPISNNEIMINVGSEIIIVDSCKNLVIKRLKPGLNDTTKREE